MELVLHEEIEYNGLFLNIEEFTDIKVLVHLKGRLETANSIHFLKFIIDLVDFSSVGCELILNMKELYYVSSTGIGAFTTILVNCKKKNMNLFMKDMQPKVKDILELLGFISFFKLI